MFNDRENGKSGSPFDKEGRIGSSYLAYDNKYGIVCVAVCQDFAIPSHLSAFDSKVST